MTLKTYKHVDCKREGNIAVQEDRQLTSPIYVQGDQLWTTAETGEVLRTPVPTLRYWRHKGVGPRSFRMGARKVMYRKSDVVAWLDAQYAAAEPKSGE